MATGIVTRTGPAIRHASAVVSMPRAQTPVGEWVAATVAAIDAGELQPCSNYGRFDCGCWEWVELMTAPAPAEPYTFTNEDLPY